MASHQHTQCPLCNTLGEERMSLSREKGILKVRLETVDIVASLKQQMAKCYGNRVLPIGRRHTNRINKKVNVQEYYVLGQNVGTSSILELVELLLQRDYPKIAIFDGSKDGTIGPIFVPEGYLPKKPKIVDPDIAEDIKSQFPDDKNLQGDVKQTEGDLLERDVYDALQSHFKSRRDENVLIVQGLEMIKLGGERGRDVHEMDFLVINFTYQYILNIEAKKWLGQIECKPENIIYKARNQLKNNRTLIEDWFGADLKGNWRYKSALYCKGMEQILKDCPSCKPFIATNKDEILDIMKSLEDQIVKKQQVKFPEDFKIIAKYLLFSAPKIPLPVTGNMVTVVHKAIQEAGSTDNIKVWCYPTPEQRLIFSSLKLILLAPWGAGKTFFMVAEAMQKAKDGEKVLFLLFANGSRLATSKKSLLAMDLELKFQDYTDNVKVETVVFKDGEDNRLEELGNGYDHIMSDELFGDIDRLTSESQKELKDFFSSKVSVWMALSNVYHRSRIDGNVDLEALVKGWFPGFQVARMRTPLRMPKTVAEHIRSGFANELELVSHLELNAMLCAGSKLPSNLVEGCQIEEFGLGEFKSFYEILEEAFGRLPKGRSAVIVIDDRLTALNKAVRSSIKCQHCRDIILVLTIDVALAKMGKKALYHCIHYSSPEQWVKEFMSGQREGEILVVSFELMRGHEHPIIMDTTNYPNIFSRTSSKLVKIYSNKFLDMMAVSEQLLSDDQHQCQTMMERQSRPQIDHSSLEMFSLFLNKKLTLKNFERSQFLPQPQDYWTAGKNPILSCLLDQMKYDQELSEKYPNESSLLDDIISALETGKILWPSAFNLMGSQRWVQKIRNDSKFYLYYARNSSDMPKYENVLLDLASQHLKREIIMVPIFDDEDVFGNYKPSKNLVSRLKNIFVTVKVKPTFYILSCQNLRKDNLFISIQMK